MWGLLVLQRRTTTEGINGYAGINRTHSMDIVPLYARVTVFSRPGKSSYSGL
jgi:hypothetical protein